MSSTDKILILAYINFTLTGNFQDLHKRCSIFPIKFHKSLTILSATTTFRFFSIFFKFIYVITWEQRKLGEIANVYDGTHQTPNYKNEGIMFLSVENIKNLQSEKYISKEDFYRDFKIYPEKNDILMTRIGDIGTTNIVRDDIPKAYYVSLALLKPQKINCEYLNIAIQSAYVQKGLMQRSLLTAIPMKINKEQIGQVDVLYPINNVEQEKIGTIFKAIDNLITLHQQIINIGGM